jgi:hypothetical protein
MDSAVMPFAANAVRLQLHALAYNLGNFLRTLATPEPIKDWSLTQRVKSTRTGRPALCRNQEFLTAVMMWAWILPVTGPGPNCLVIAAAAASVASAKRSGS